MELNIVTAELPRMVMASINLMKHTDSLADSKPVSKIIIYQIIKIRNVSC